MNDYLDLACKHLGVDKGSVIKHRIQGDNYSVIVDNGILGCPKYYVPISQLEELRAQPAALPVPAAVDLNYRELQDIAKELGIPANQKADELRAALWPEEPPFGVALLSLDEEE